MSHRQAIFSYLRQFLWEEDKDAKEGYRKETVAEYKLRQQLSVGNDEESQKRKYLQFKVRLLYAMMFYSFEIQNDMLLSVNIYQML